MQALTVPIRVCTAASVSTGMEDRRPSAGRSWAVKMRAGFTLIELLVAMALVVLVMAIVSQAFVEGLESFRHLKGIGDLAERLREASLKLNADILATNEEARDFIEAGLLTGSVDRAQATELAARYEAIYRSADELQGQFQAIKTDRPEAVRAIARAVESLERLKISAKLMIELLALINPPTD